MTYIPGDGGDCGVCEGHGYLDEDHTVVCPSCKGDGVSTFPEETRFAIEVRIIETKVIWVEGDSPSDALQRAKDDGELYEYFSHEPCIEGWWEVEEHSLSTYDHHTHQGPMEMCSDSNGRSWAVPVGSGGYGHTRSCERHPHHNEEQK